MKQFALGLLFSALLSAGASIPAKAAVVTILNPVSDGSFYDCSGCVGVSDGGYVLLSGYIQGVVKFSSSNATRSASNVKLTVNPYGLPLFGPSIDIYGFGSTSSNLVQADGNAGTLIGTFSLPTIVGYGQDITFDVTSFVRTVTDPVIGFNLRSQGTDVFSSLEYNYGHPSQLIVTNDSTPVPEPSTWLLISTGFGLLGGCLRANRKSLGISGQNAT